MKATAVTMAILLALLLAIALMSGCTIVSGSRTADWPQLRVTEHKMTLQQVQAKCDQFVLPFMSSYACSWVNLDAGTCDIYYFTDWTLEHERKHCEGYDHVGSSLFDDLVARWKANKLRAGQ